VAEATGVTRTCTPSPQPPGLAALNESARPTAVAGSVGALPTRITSPRPARTSWASGAARTTDGLAPDWYEAIVVVRISTLPPPRSRVTGVPLHRRRNRWLPCSGVSPLAASEVICAKQPRPSWPEDSTDPLAATRLT